ncbi:Uma2 family endonuclease [Nostoc sp.]|uniref:Uma2 family endonuclease n=1 Tax=Nostoc sp. TaxID=1180 RepID=UPI002FFBDD1E
MILPLTWSDIVKFGDLPTLPQSFPLIAEIVSPTDLAEELFLKAQEYLQSGCEEVWLVFPESRLVFVMTDNQVLGFKAGDVVSTQKVLLGFSVAIDELLG